MSEFQPIEAHTRDRVRAMHDQSRLPRLHEMVPHVQVWPVDTSRSIAGYKLDRLSDPLVQVSLDNWDKGDNPGGADKINEDEVTLGALQGFKAKNRKKVMSANFDSRFAYFSQRGPELLDEVHRMYDLRVASTLVNTSAFSTEAWSGTGALDTRASDHLPSKDINNFLRSTGVRRLATQMSSSVKLVAIMDAEVATILQDFTVYSGRGSDSNNPQHQDFRMFRNAFGMTHSIAPDDVKVHEAVYDSAREGQTSSRANIHNGVLWIGLVDRNQSFDLTAGDDAEGPDGGIAMQVAYEPYLKSWFDEGEEMEYYSAAGSMGVLTPRYTGSSLETGIFFPASQNFT